ncbi:hypothetical protein [Nocardia cerradoensis]|uniref:DNA-directed RNA polymerase subunit beta n=1 Tax=Nocardia cerradoensis TaxID=85688 RepID=A0A231HCD1_9NOCA|nr:hypothetical protein [Nocardia cerradoensis]OXR46426.1 hypothetical protein B7C42_01392 [Nocardia cerradoensis]
MSTRDPMAGAIEPNITTITTAPRAVTQEALVRCRRYRKENGLYGIVEPVRGRILLEIGPVGAITVPAALGAPIREYLSVRGHRGPIIGHPRSARWTFLTGHVDESATDAAIASDMFHRCAALVTPGTTIVLPSPADERTGYRVWIDSPHGDYRPELAEVLTATRQCRPDPY